MPDREEELEVILGVGAITVAYLMRFIRGEIPDALSRFTPEQRQFAALTLGEIFMDRFKKLGIE